MNLIERLLTPEKVLLELDVASKKRVFEYAGLLFEKQHCIAHGQVFDSLFAREKLGSTALGCGIAIPHGRIKGLRDAVGALIRTSRPIPFDAPDGQAVDLIFVLMVPERATDLHLQILSELAQMLSDKTFRSRLAGCVDAAATYHLVAQWHVHAENQRSAAV